MKRFTLPACLQGLCAEGVYLRWLQRKAQAHVRRDRKRGETCTAAEYKARIHEAVCAGGDRDHYTGLPLDWSLISKFDNASAKQGRGAYFKTFANLPTVDHAQDGAGQPRFVICAWRVNDAKSHLSEEEFCELCRQVLAHRGSRPRAGGQDAGQ